MKMDVNLTEASNSLNKTEDSEDIYNFRFWEILTIALKELQALSPLAWTIITVSAITIILICLTTYCMCSHYFGNRKKGSSCSPDFVVKVPVGQPAPIPLTGLVNLNKSKDDLNKNTFPRNYIHGYDPNNKFSKLNIYHP